MGKIKQILLLPLWRGLTDPTSHGLWVTEQKFQPRAHSTFETAPQTSPSSKHYGFPESWVSLTVPVLAEAILFFLLCSKDTDPDFESEEGHWVSIRPNYHLVRTRAKARAQGHTGMRTVPRGSCWCRRLAVRMRAPSAGFQPRHYVTMCCRIWSWRQLSLRTPLPRP